MRKCRQSLAQIENLMQRKQKLGLPYRVPNINLSILLAHTHIQIDINTSCLHFKVKVNPIYDAYVGEVPVREDTFPGSSAL